MPRRNDIAKILVIGSGPIVIGQSAEFDYSGTQACKALKAEGYEVVLVNSNPASIMTDPEVADRTYIEPLTPAYVEEILRVESEMLKPGSGRVRRAADGGRADGAEPGRRSGGLRRAREVRGGADRGQAGGDQEGGGPAAVQGCDDQDRARYAAVAAGEQCVRRAGVCGEDRVSVRHPASFTLGGSGGGIAYNREEMTEILSRGIDLSPVSECLIEESVLGWKEYELEVVRDLNDNVIIICSIENFDPMGVHTGDSITVAPAQTLTDREYQAMRDAAIAVIREIGVETGGSNVQFAVNPQNGRMTVIEMNPRVSRSSALASKATGFPIAKIAARLAVGYTLDELQNDITKATPACFEPTIDYVVVKIPKWQFEKFPGADENLGRR